MLPSRISGQERLRTRRTPSRSRTARTFFNGCRGLIAARFYRTKKQAADTQSQLSCSGSGAPLYLKKHALRHFIKFEKIMNVNRLLREFLNPERVAEMFNGAVFNFWFGWPVCRFFSIYKISYYSQGHLLNPE